MKKTLLLVTAALIAFAANSILCRYALGEQKIDPISFTFIRLASGAVMLNILLFLFTKSKNNAVAPQNTIKKLLGASYLLLYAICFSIAYITLNTATGALLLFGTVQIFMMGFTLIKGQRLTLREWIGFTVACTGFLLLTLPYVTTPSASGLILMVVAGIGWAFYTLNGKGSTQALKDSAINFSIATVFIIPIAGLLLLFSDTALFYSPQGIMAAVASGALASGVGYAIWYKVLPHISTAQAATSQLLVPVIAGIGGLLLLQETLSVLLIVSGLIMLSGIYLMIKKSG